MAPPPQPRTLWEEGRMPARDVVTLCTAVLLSAVLIDLALSERLGLFYDLVFVTACVATALAVRPTDFFSAGTLPPLVMAGVVLLVAIAQPAAVAAPQDGVVQATISGLSSHALALVAGYAACLAVLAARRRVTPRR